MNSEKLYNGYSVDFLDKPVNLPILSSDQEKDLFRNENFPNGIIPYIHFSLSLSKTYYFPYYIAANISGQLFKKVPRKDSWRKDPRVKDSQWGIELYSTRKGAFDRGHMAKREDVQWGETLGIALKAADSTFYYTNAVPQHKKLNRDIWKSLEDYILNTETVKNQLKVCVMTGPSLSSSNPWSNINVKGKRVQLPMIFWKVIYFTKNDGELYRVGFIMNQEQLLLKDGLIENLESKSQSNLFLNFKDSATYQVNLKTIEEISLLQFHPAIESYRDERPIKLIMEEIDIDPELESFSIDQILGFRIVNINL